MSKICNSLKYDMFTFKEKTVRLKFTKHTKRVTCFHKINEVQSNCN